MKKQFLISSALVAVVLLAINFSSCKKKAENQAPVVTLNEPDDNSSIAMGDSLHIEGTASDDEELHEMSVLVVSHMGDTVLSDYPYVHGKKTYDFHYHFHPADTGMFHLHITAEDHEEAATHVERMFSVTP